MSIHNTTQPYSASPTGNVDQQSTSTSQRGKAPGSSLYVTGIPAGTYKKLENVTVSGVKADGNSISQLPRELREIHVSGLGEGSRVKTIRNLRVAGIDVSVVGTPKAETRKPSPVKDPESSDESSSSSSDEETPKAVASKKRETPAKKAPDPDVSSDEEMPTAAEPKKRETPPAKKALESSDESSSSSDEETPKVGESKKCQSPLAAAKEERPRTVQGRIGITLTGDDLRRMVRQGFSGHMRVYNDAGGPGRTEMHNVRVMDVATGIFLDSNPKIDEEVQELAKSYAKDLMVDHQPALVWMAEHGKAETMKALIQGGADVNGVDDAGQTALHKAVASKSLDKALLLLANGADPMAKDAAGTTPVSLASYIFRDTDDKKMINLLDLYKKS